LLVICPSKWIHDCAKRSRLFNNCDLHIISTGVDLNTFSPKNKLESRNKLELDNNKKFILFGAMNATNDKRKGWEYLKKSLNEMKKHNLLNNFELMIFGNENNNEIPNLDIKINYFNQIYDEKILSMIYSSADVFVSPSIAENLANTCIESIACGTPVVAFNIGGMNEIIDHKDNGYLAEPYDHLDLAKGIDWSVTNSENMEKKARDKAKKNFCIKKNTKKLIQILNL
jgi:glycosyltransferase involved in cell wall biosynthesis